MKRAIIFMLLLIPIGLTAQQDIHLNRLTVYGGMTRYLGEIQQSWDQVDPQSAGYTALGYQRFLGYGTSAYGQLSVARIQGNDLDGGNLSRGLNFRSELRTLELGFRSYLDNGSWLNYDARFAPFLSIGAGFGTYAVRVDQYDALGARYNYWSDGSVRDLAETDPNAGSAIVVGQDGNFEKEVTGLATENDKPSQPNYFFIPAQLGVKVRLTQHLSLDLAYGFQWAFTDHLDDISGVYPNDIQDLDLAYLSDPTNASGMRGDPSDNDHYHHVSIGMAFSFGRRADRYRMNPIHVDALPPVPVEPVVKPEPTSSPRTPPIERVQTQDTLRVRYLVIEKLIVDTIISHRSTLQTTASTDLIADTNMVDSMDTAPSKQTPPQETGPNSTIAQPNDTLPGPTRSSVAKGLVPDSGSTSNGAKSLVAGSVADSTAIQKLSDQGNSDPRSVSTRGTEDVTINQGSNGSNSKTAVIPIPVPVGGGNKKEVRELEDSLARMQVRQDQMAAEIARLTRDSTTVLLDSSVTSTDTTFVAGATTVLSNDSIASVDSTMVEIPFDRLTYDRHNATLNDLMLDRIGLLEMYLSLQEQEAPDSVRYDLEQQVQLLDAQVAALRDSIAALHFQGEVEPDKATLKSDSLRIHTNRASTDTLFFSSGSRYVQDRYRERLRMIAVDFLSQGKGKLIVTGHSDRSGKATFNLALSQQRAETVAKVLREAGVPDSAMTVKGLGEKLAQSTYNVKERNVVVQMVILD